MWCWWWWGCHARDHWALCSPAGYDSQLITWLGTPGSGSRPAQTEQGSRPGAQEADSARARAPSCTLCVTRTCHQSRALIGAHNVIPASDWSSRDGHALMNQFPRKFSKPMIWSGRRGAGADHVSSVGQAVITAHRPGHLPWEILPLLESGNTETGTNTDWTHRIVRVYHYP